MKPFAALLLALMAVTGQAQVSPDSVTIRFELASRTPGCVATVLYPDYFACHSRSLKPATDQMGCWAVTLPAPHTLHVQLWDDNKIEGVVWNAINLFCRPGTEVTIHLDDVNNHVTFSGENAEVHQAQMRYPLRIETFHGAMFNMEIQEAARHIRTIRQRNLHAIDTLRIAHPDIPAGYIEMLRSIERYGFAMDMTQNVLGHMAENFEQIVELGNQLPNDYLKLLREVETDEFLRPTAPLAIEALSYLSDMMSLESIARYGFIRENSDCEDQKLAWFAEECALADSLPASPDLRELMKLSCSFLTEESELTPARWAFLETQLSPKLLSLYRHHVSNRAEARASISYEAASELEAMPMDSLIDGRDIFQKLIAPYRGRVVYVDVWGTWCGPCLRELEHVSELHAALEGLDVMYMYLANQSPEELWQKASKRFGLDGADCVNLRLPDDQQRAVEQYLGVSGYPTYLLVAPDGTIATADAPRPSLPVSVRQAILRLLDQGTTL